MTESVLLQGGTLHLPQGPRKADLLVRDGIIREISDEIKPHDNATVLDASELSVTPGLIDIHIHGCRGYSVMDAKRSSLEQISLTLAEHGITGFLATTITSDPEDLTEALKFLAQMQKELLPGAKMLGCHLEGPFISSSFAGIQSRELIAPLKTSLAEPYFQAADGCIKLATITADKPESLRMMEYFAARGCVVSVGHTGASYEQVKSAMKHGAKSLTHTFNAMSQLDRKHPNAVGAALTLDDLYCELICDLHHVHPVCIEVLLRCKPRDKIILISDATRVSLQPDGYYELAGHIVQARNGQVYNEEGRLAGAWSLLDEGVRNMIARVGVPPHDAVAFASINPATMLGIASLGRLEVGAVADVTAWDSDWRAVLTLINGKIVSDRGSLSIPQR